MRRIPEFSVGHPVAVLMIVLGVALLGWISFQRLGIDLFPRIDSPRLFMEIEAGERPPEEIEQRIVDRLEDLVFRQKGVADVSSLIRVGSARITVEYGWNMDMNEAFLNLQKVAADFGQGGEVDRIIITQHDPNSDPIMIAALTHPDIDDMDLLRRTAEDLIRNELVRVEGIAGVGISGGEVTEVLVETDEYRLEAYGLTIAGLASTIGAYDADVSGGTISEMGIEYLIKGVSVLESIEDIAGIIVAWKDPDGAAAAGQAASPQRSPVLLGDVARVTLRNRDPENIVRLNGERCVGLSIYKEMKYNTVKASASLHQALARLEQALPGCRLHVIADQGRFISAAVGEVRRTALIGILLAVIVLYVFLRRIGTTAIISISIPISIVATFNLMYFKGLTLNIMTLGGLALGAGMLVDNAIVVVENIVRNIESGMGARAAAVAGAAQVGGAITASTITTIVVFLPIVYLHGAAGALFKEQAWTVAFALLSSLAVAVLVIPMLAGKFLRAGPAAARRSVNITRYGALLEKALDRRAAVIGAAAALVAAAILLVPVVGSEFIPSADANEFSLDLRLPEGTELMRTAGTVAGIEDALRSSFGETVEMIYSVAGPAPGLGYGESALLRDEHTALIRVRLADRHGMPLDRVMTGLGAPVADLPGVQASLVQEQAALRTTLGGAAAPIVIEIAGDDLDVLAGLAEQARERLGGIGDLYNIETSIEGGRPEVNVVIDRLQAGLLQASLADITASLRDRLSGRRAGDWDDGGVKRDITLKLPDVSLAELERVTIDSGSGSLRLDEIASLRPGRAPREIIRNNQVRSALVTAHKREGRPFNHAVAEIRRSLDGVALPAGYRIEITGEEEKRSEEFKDLRFALLLSIVLVYMVLASQFESLVHPFVILLTVPLAGVGAVLIFLAAGKPLNVMALIGIIMLAGIAVNDSIILIDAINGLRRAGAAKRAAIVEAGRRRIRPIIMTSATTILALLPLSFGFGEGAALRSPMALAVIGGLVTSTALTLFVIPCVYSLLDRSE